MVLWPGFSHSLPASFRRAVDGQERGYQKDVWKPIRVIFLGIQGCQVGDRERFQDIQTWNHLTVFVSSNSQIRLTTVTKNVPQWKQTKSCYGWVIQIKVRRDMEILNLLHRLFTSCILIHVSRIWARLSLRNFTWGFYLFSETSQRSCVCWDSTDTSSPDLLLELQTYIQLLIWHLNLDVFYSTWTWKLSPKWNSWLLPARIISALPSTLPLPSILPSSVNGAVVYCYISLGVTLASLLSYFPRSTARPTMLLPSKCISKSPTVRHVHSHCVGLWLLSYPAWTTTVRSQMLFLS